MNRSNFEQVLDSLMHLAKWEIFLRSRQLGQTEAARTKVFDKTKIEQFVELCLIQAKTEITSGDARKAHEIILCARDAFEIVKGLRAIDVGADEIADRSVLQHRGIGDVMKTQDVIDTISWLAKYKAAVGQTDLPEMPPDGSTSGAPGGGAT